MSLEGFRKPDQVLKFRHLWSRSSDFSSGFIFARHCDSTNRFQVLPYSFMAKEFGSPYDDLVALTDGTILKLCMPGGLGNQKSRMDQPEGQLYHETSEKAANGINHFEAIFLNGMILMAVSSPNFSI